MAGKIYGEANSDDNVAHPDGGKPISEADGPKADNARNKPSGDRELKAGSGNPAKR